MARLPRLTVPGFPHHVIQRGNNRQATFHDTADYEMLLGLLADYARREKVAIHSYALMTNHFHLLATPETQDGLPKMMQAVGRRYVQYFNKRHQRTGTLWEGRYKATLIQTERYLLACMAYIDLNPVRAGMVARAADYRWSSHGHYIGQRSDKLITPHPMVWQLGNTPFAREAGYAELVQQGVTAQQQAALSESVFKGWALGEPDFVDHLQKQTQRRVTRGRAGRPSSKAES
ncbi:MAG: transposase [Stenotrophobium sp.]